MFEHFESICYHLFSPTGKADPLPVFNPAQQFTDASNEPAGIARQLNAAFLILLAGKNHPDHRRAQTFLHQEADSTHGKEMARFYLAAVDQIHTEIENV